MLAPIKEPRDILVTWSIEIAEDEDGDDMIFGWLISVEVFIALSPRTYK